MPKITLLGNGGAIWLLMAFAMLITKGYRKYGAFMLAGLALGVLTGNLIMKPLIARPRTAVSFSPPGVYAMVKSAETNAAGFSACIAWPQSKRMSAQSGTSARTR